MLIHPSRRQLNQERAASARLSRCYSALHLLSMQDFSEKAGGERGIAEITLKSELPSTDPPQTLIWRRILGESGSPAMPAPGGPRFRFLAHSRHSLLEVRRIRLAVSTACAPTARAIKLHSTGLCLPGRRRMGPLCVEKEEKGSTVCKSACLCQADPYCLTWQSHADATGMAYTPK